MSKTNFLSVIAIAAIFISAFTCESAYAQTKRQKKQLEKMEGDAAFEARKAELEADQARRKQFKTKADELSKEGWKAEGTRTIEVALLDHYKKDPDGNKSHTPIVNNNKTINLGKRSALTQAQNYYAQRATNHVKGTVGEVLLNNGVPQTDIDKVLAKYGGIVDKKVGELLVESYTLVRERGNFVDVQTAFIIVEQDKASQMRIDAMKQSMLETKIVGMELEEILKAVGHTLPIE